MADMRKKIIEQYIEDYELGNLEISKGGKFQDFISRLISYYSRKEKTLRRVV